MLEVKWEYFKDNIGRNGSVAVLKTQFNQPILTVYEGSNCHYSIASSTFPFIDMYHIPFSEESDIVNKKYRKETLDLLSAHDVLALRLEEGCKIIEEDFFNQASKVIELLSK